MCGNLSHLETRLILSLHQDEKKIPFKTAGIKFYGHHTPNDQDQKGMRNNVTKTDFSPTFGKCVCDF